MKNVAAFSALILALVGFAPTANTQPQLDGFTVVVTMEWGSAKCIDFLVPTPASGRTKVQKYTNCDKGIIPGTGFTSASYFAPAGTLVGLDPEIGANDWVGCRITDADGAEIWSDYGTKGDGHDINCLREVLPQHKAPQGKPTGRAV